MLSFPKCDVVRPSLTCSLVSFFVDARSEADLTSLWSCARVPAMLRQIAKDHENNENNDDDFHNYQWYAIIVNVYQLLRENFFHTTASSFVMTS